MMIRQFLRAGLFFLFIFTFVFIIPGAAGGQETVKPTVKEVEMVLISGGEFMMGRERKPQKDPAKKVYIDDYPHKVQVDTFYMDKYEVTNAQYQRFCEATKNKLPEFWGMKKYKCGPEYPEHTVLGVTFGAAKKYAEWKGKRLPTEAEWEYAARGGLEGKSYPNGDKMDKKQANVSADKTGTVKVGSYAPNGYGLHDMCGNVAEWTTDFYAKDYYKTSPLKNPQGPEIGKRRVTRGGGWHAGKSCCRVFVRYSLRTYFVDFNLGFRCVKNEK
ncbi:MAG: formylglycine-generating enzyme family protein [bacterium]|nr:formylglycine-generating enzyme family protein [bacterium]